jgi:hypothetical protein
LEGLANSEAIIAANAQVLAAQTVQVLAEGAKILFQDAAAGMTDGLTNLQRAMALLAGAPVPEVPEAPPAPATPANPPERPASGGGELVPSVGEVSREGFIGPPEPPEPPSRPDLGGRLVPSVGEAPPAPPIVDRTTVVERLLAREARATTPEEIQTARAKAGQELLAGFAQNQREAGAGAAGAQGAVSGAIERGRIPEGPSFIERFGAFVGRLEAADGKNVPTEGGRQAGRAEVIGEFINFLLTSPTKQRDQQVYGVEGSNYVPGTGQGAVQNVTINYTGPLTVRSQEDLEVISARSAEMLLQVMNQASSQPSTGLPPSINLPGSGPF